MATKSPTKRKAKRKRLPKKKVAARPGRPTKLDQKLTDDICTFIRAGAYRDQAAIAVGIGYRTFARWMERGDKADRMADAGKTVPELEIPYWKFWQQVEQSGGKARVDVEKQVRKDNPTFWLRNGPGKTRANRQGWTDAIGEAPIDGETGKPVDAVDTDALLAKLDGIRHRALAEQAKTKKRRKGKRPKPKPRG